MHWEELAEYEQHYIPALPVSFKEALLSYISVYGNKRCLDFKSFKILFQDEAESSISACDEVRFLDLSELLNEHFAISDLVKCFKHPTTLLAQEFEKLEVGNTTSTRKIEKPIAESWEEEAEEQLLSPPPALAATLKIPHFANLSSLSLAHPGQWASWPELLRIAPHLSKITHLSLAYWPRPSMTPNAITTSMVSNHTSVSLGGSHFYSDLDDDWHEAANILRRFSAQTYSLHWLDLEGCTWLKALTWHSAAAPPSTPSRSGSQDVEAWLTHSTSPGPDWNDAWRRIEYLNVFQGWIPSDNQSLQNMPAGIVPAQLMRWLRDAKDSEDMRAKLNAHETGHAVAEWVQREKVSRVVGQEIQSLRKKGVGIWCRVDHGWGAGSGEKMS